IRSTSAIVSSLDITAYRLLYSVCMSDVRPMAVAGSWYPETAEPLAREIEGYLAGASVADAAPPIAIVSPHAGLRYSGPVAAFAYKAAGAARYSSAVLV